MQDKKLEALIIKQTAVKDQVTKILTINFKLDKDLAELIALDTIQQAIGIKGVRPKHYLWHYLYKHSKAIKTTLGIAVGIPTVYYVGKWLLTFVLIVFVALGSFCSTHCSEYPKVEKLPENYQFINETYQSEGSGSIYNKLCLPYKGNLRGNDNSCIHQKKIDEVNARLKQAVDTDFNGIVWEGANGYGEVWTIERNNYRFVITRQSDPEFK